MPFKPFGIPKLPPQDGKCLARIRDAQGQEGYCQQSSVDGGRCPAHRTERLTEARRQQVQVVEASDAQRASTELRKINQEAQKLVGVLGLKSSAASKNQFILERLDELEQAKQAAEERLAAIEVGIQRLESRQIDAEIIRTNLKRFTEVFEKLTLPERKDFLRLLLKEVLYNHQQDKIKLTLRQLPDLGLEVIDGKVSFDERQIWLPGQDSAPSFAFGSLRSATRRSRGRSALLLVAPTLMKEVAQLHRLAVLSDQMKIIGLVCCGRFDGERLLH